MDSPNSGFELIHKFPIDILAGIMLFVPGEDIGRLKMAGCKSLWSILTCPNVVKSVKLGNGGLRFKSWPSFMNEFPSLESLRIESNYPQWWSDLKLTLDQLPSTLQTLSLLAIDRHLSFIWSCDRFFEIPNSSATVRLDEHLPHLEALEIHFSDATNFDWVSHCPPTLTSLYVYQWKPDIDLPSSLIHFRSLGELPTRFPRSLQTLGCGNEHYSHSLPCLTSLSGFLGKGQFPQLEDIMSLPHTLTNLDVRNTLPSSTWSSLPAKLESLSFHASNANCTVLSRIVDPIDGEVHQLKTCPLELLPKSLTKIHISGVYGCHIFVSGCCSSLFPPHLTSFDAPYLRLAPNAAKQLPSSLTHLSTFQLYEQLCEHLPEGLTSLSFKNAFLSPKTIQCLPKSLTMLVSYEKSLYGEERWFDFTTGETILCSPSLPEYSINKDYASYFACLPPNLTFVYLSNFQELQDEFIQNQNFSNLLSLTLWDVGQFSDNCIPFLNRHLTRLEVCFKSLPRSLKFLRLGSSSSIFDEDIQHLPRTLKEIRIPCAVELTDACIRDIPRGCEQFDVSKNTNITELCIPDLSLSMRSLTVTDRNLKCVKILHKLIELT